MILIDLSLNNYSDPLINPFGLKYLSKLLVRHLSPNLLQDHFSMLQEQLHFVMVHLLRLLFLDDHLLFFGVLVIMLYVFL